MKKRTILFIAILALSLIAISVAQNNKITLKEIRDCKTINWETEEQIYGTCQREYIKTVCDDPPINKSCYQKTEYYNYTCKTGTKIIPHSKKVCTPKAFEITKEIGATVTERGRINFKEWGKCSYEKEGNNLIIICDSKFDGNNDGICQSGESCVKFVVTQDKVKHYLKNSQEEFTVEDKSFFLEKLDYEVMSK